ncbi:molecular chaperone Tir [Levilactobacillus brevis]|uniref:TIR domain-containing protein n=1 Tax=Levilactobacillus brevis TaxID=1580 RepID=UPI000C1B0F26|nr:TIR domain-containing protein [Levilactobacillus brevis]ATU69069.1 molecular chaperone Tir [Levilactobacillus brevis]
MAYRNKVYVAFDGDNDMRYYDLMRGWNVKDDFDFNDAHDLHSARDSSTEESIKKSLMDRFNNSKLFIILIGEHTRYLTKFVKWEIEVAIRLNLPIIAVNLNDKRQGDDLMPAVLRDELHITVPYKEKIIKYAMDNWPDSDKKHRGNGETGEYVYKDKVYEDLGL